MSHCLGYGVYQVICFHLQVVFESRVSVAANSLWFTFQPSLDPDYNFYEWEADICLLELASESFVYFFAEKK